MESSIAQETRGVVSGSCQTLDVQSYSNPKTVTAVSVDFKPSVLYRQVLYQATELLRQLSWLQVKTKYNSSTDVHAYTNAHAKIALRPVYDIYIVCTVCSAINGLYSSTYICCIWSPIPLSCKVKW